MILNPTNSTVTSFPSFADDEEELRRKGRNVALDAADLGQGHEQNEVCIFLGLVNRSRKYTESA